MIRGTNAHPPGHQVDQADIISMPTIGGARVELMRTTYHRQAFPRHSHEYLTFGVMLRGVGTLWVGGSDHRMHRGDVVVIPPGQVHTGGMERGTKVLSYLAVHVPAEVIAICADSHGFRGGNALVFVSPIIRDADVAGALLRVDAATRGALDVKGVGASSGSGASPPFDACAADEALTTAIDLLVARYADSSTAADRVPSNPEPRLVPAVREIIEG